MLSISGGNDEYTLLSNFHFLETFWHKFFHFFMTIGFPSLLINFFIILPIVFNFFVIPKIEKRLGIKFKYSGLVYNDKASIWFASHIELGHTIVAKYLIWKIKGKIKVGGKSPFVDPLHQTNYDIREASKLEIIMSFIATMNSILFITLFIIACLLPK